MTIRYARSDEAALAHDILREATSWLISRGQELWNEKEITIGEVTARAENDELVLGFEDGAPIACMYLQNEDRAFWPETPERSAYYVHRLAVRRSGAGSGWSQRLLDWAAEQARRDSRNFVRLDSEPRPRLLRLYEDNGFFRVDPEPLQVGRHLVVRFQRPV